MTRVVWGFAAGSLSSHSEGSYGFITRAFPLHEGEELAAWEGNRPSIKVFSRHARLAHVQWTKKRCSRLSEGKTKTEAKFLIKTERKKCKNT